MIFIKIFIFIFIFWIINLLLYGKPTDTVAEPPKEPDKEPGNTDGKKYYCVEWNLLTGEVKEYDSE